MFSFKKQNKYTQKDVGDFIQKIVTRDDLTDLEKRHILDILYQLQIEIMVQNGLNHAMSLILSSTKTSRPK